jgi:hypothetical protein
MSGCVLLPVEYICAHYDPPGRAWRLEHFEKLEKDPKYAAEWMEEVMRRMPVTGGKQ